MVENANNYFMLHFSTSLQEIKAVKQTTLYDEIQSFYLNTRIILESMEIKIVGFPFGKIDGTPAMWVFEMRCSWINTMKVFDIFHLLCKLML
jgi:hypothetical protein